MQELLTNIRKCDVCAKHLDLGPRPIVSGHVDSKIFAIVPMGFCYPGKGKSGDLPPRPECAPLWHEQLMKSMPKIELVILIGMYAQKYYLKKEAKKTLTETVRNYQDYLPNYFVLPHPSPRNRFWLTKNPWFEQEVVGVLSALVADVLKN